jgi:hypothetical protein
MSVYLQDYDMFNEPVCDEGRLNIHVLLETSLWIMKQLSK